MSVSRPAFVGLMVERLSSCGNVALINLTFYWNCCSGDGGYSTTNFGKWTGFESLLTDCQCGGVTVVLESMSGWSVKDECWWIVWNDSSRSDKSARIKLVCTN